MLNNLLRNYFIKLLHNFVSTKEYKNSHSQKDKTVIRNIL